MASMRARVHASVEEAQESVAGRPRTSDLYRPTLIDACVIVVTVAFRSHVQIGLDDKIDESERFMEQRQVLGKKVIEDGYIPIARQYAKFGTPASLRPAIWRIILGLPEVRVARVVRVVRGVCGVRR